MDMQTLCVLLQLQRDSLTYLDGEAFFLYIVNIGREDTDCIGVCMYKALLCLTIMTLVWCISITSRGESD